MPTNAEYAQLAKAAYDNTGAPNGWLRLQIPNPSNSTGYYGAAFGRVNESGAVVEVVVANRGTEAASSSDWYSNAQMGLNKLPDQYQFAKDFLKDVKAANKNVPITLTGHSLGGSLAQLLAAETGLTAVTFNPYGAKELIPALNDRYGLTIDSNATYNNIVNHQTNLDGVSRIPASTQIGQMQNHLAPSEIVGATLVVSSSATGPVGFTLTYLAERYVWSHSIDRFAKEVFAAQDSATTSWEQDFIDFTRDLNARIQVVEQTVTSTADQVVTQLKSDFQQLSGTVGQTYENAVNTTTAAMDQLSNGLDAAGKSLVKAFVDFTLGLSNPFASIDKLIATAFTASQSFFIPVRRMSDPLILDLDDDGLETVGPAQSGVLFDHDADGIKTGTGWVKADDGFLVMDRNNNGAIDNGRELFGDATLLYAGGTAADGFAALAQEDSNGDGKVNSLDANWSKLRVWRDLNQDGASQPAELLTMTQAGVASFNVAKTANGVTLTNGNQIADLGAYTKTDGATGTLGETSQLADVNLAQDTFHSAYTDQLAIDDDVKPLPGMQGLGNVHSLHRAMARDANASNATRFRLTA